MVQLPSDLISFHQYTPQPVGSLGMNTTCPLPLGILKVSFRSSTSAGGQFEDLPILIPRYQFRINLFLGCSENDFIHHLLSKDFPLRDFRNLKEFPHHWVIAGVLKGGFVIILDEIEEGAEVGIAGMLGELFVAFR
jgi:hypothetical protein